VEPQRGIAAVATEGGAVMTGLSSRALPGVAPGDRVDVQLVPSGRPPSAVGGEASESGVMGRILPPLPPFDPGVGLRESP
jgi:hypothetical protein